MKAYEWHAKYVDGISPGTNDFYHFYYLLTAVHAFHVAIGLGVLAFMWTMARRPELTPAQVALTEGSACFWHMVDLLWIAIFPLLYLVR